MEIGGPSAAGTMWLTGGLLITSNNTDIGESGLGQMTVSNGIWQAGSEVVGDFSGSQGTLTIAGGTNRLRSSFTVGNNAGVTGTVWMTDGLLTVSNGFVNIGSQGVGRMTVSNGTWTSRNVVIAFGGSSQGTLTIAGGTTICTNMILGSANCAAVGILNVAGGAVYVTNAAGNATLEVRSGTLTLNSGTLGVDTFVLTNSCARFIRNGGAITYRQLVFNPALSSVGDGIPDAWRAIFFGGDGTTTNSSSCASCDPDGDGQNNLAEFLSGSDPTNSLSALRIISAVRQTTDVVITWRTVGGRTNAVQATTGGANGSYTTNGFADISGSLIIAGSGDATTNHTDAGGATNVPARFYRVRLVP